MKKKVTVTLSNTHSRPETMVSLNTLTEQEKIDYYNALVDTRSSARKLIDELKKLERRLCTGKAA